MLKQTYRLPVKIDTCEAELRDWLAEIKIRGVDWGLPFAKQSAGRRKFYLDYGPPITVIGAPNPGKGRLGHILLIDWDTATKIIIDLTGSYDFEDQEDLYVEEKGYLMGAFDQWVAEMRREATPDAGDGDTAVSSQAAGDGDTAVEKDSLTQLEQGILDVRAEFREMEIPKITNGIIAGKLAERGIYNKRSGEPYSEEYISRKNTSLREKGYDLD